MNRAAGQAPQQETFDRAGRERALLGRGAGASDMVEYPRDLGAREIGIEQQAGAIGEELLVTIFLQRGAAVGGTPVLPHDGVVDRLAGGAIPHDGCFALICDADAGQCLGIELGLGQRAATHFDRGRPDLLRIVLDPARLGEDLRQFLLRRGDRTSGHVEDDGAGAGRALVDGEDVLGSHRVFVDA